MCLILSLSKHFPVFARPRTERRYFHFSGVILCLRVTSCWRQVVSVATSESSTGLQVRQKSRFRRHDLRTLCDVFTHIVLKKLYFGLELDPSYGDKRGCEYNVPKLPNKTMLKFEVTLKTRSLSPNFKQKFALPSTLTQESPKRTTKKITPRFRYHFVKRQQTEKDAKGIDTLVGFVPSASIFEGTHSQLFVPFFLVCFSLSLFTHISILQLKANKMTAPFKVIEANERQPLVSLAKRPSEHPTQSEKKSSNLIEWSDVEQATHLVTEGDDQATWRPSSPIVSIMESVSAQVCCKSSWLSSKALEKLPLSRKKDREALVKLVKNAGSLALLSLSVYIVMAAIWTNQTKVAQATNPLVATVTMWSLIIWLGLMEGGQGSLVGLQPIDKDIYAKTHPIAHQCAVLAHEGENLNRFILGRQFLVFLVVFVVNMCSSAVPETKIPFVSDSLVEIFLDSGLATIIITVILGQLAAEVNATKSMFDFVNSYFMLVTLWITLAVEWSGLLHAVYLVQYLFAWATGKSPSDGVSRSTVEETFFWLRVIFSTAVLGYACTFTFVALFHGQTDMYKGVPNPVTVVLFFVLLCVIGMMEGMQIALFAVVNLPEEELKNHHVARANCDLTFTGSNFQAFLSKSTYIHARPPHHMPIVNFARESHGLIHLLSTVGRQVCVTFALFVLATIITIDVDMAPLLDGSHEPTVMGVSTGMQGKFCFARLVFSFVFCC